MVVDKSGFVDAAFRIEQCSIRLTKSCDGGEGWVLFVNQSILVEGRSMHLEIHLWLSTLKTKTKEICVL